MPGVGRERLKDSKRAVSLVSIKGWSWVLKSATIQAALR